MAENTANERIRNSLVRHQVALLRYSGGLSSRIIALLDKTEPELTERILARLSTQRARGFDSGPVTTARLKALRDFLSSLADTIEVNQRSTFDRIDVLVRDEMLELARDEVDYAQRAIVRDVGLELVFATPTAGELRSIVLSRPFQGQLLKDWLKQFRANDRSRMLAEIQKGMLSQETPTQIAQRIFGTKAAKGNDGVRAITRRGAQTLAQTATAAISSNARQAFYKANSKLFSQELFVATLDSRTTPQCRSLDGNLYDIGKGPQTPVHMNCRSMRIPAVDGRAVAGMRPANRATEKALAGLRGDARRKAVQKLVGQVPSSVDYTEFLKDSPAEFRKSVMGKTRAALFDTGKLPLDKFVDRSGRQYTIKELRTREPEAFRAAGL